MCDILESTKISQFFVCYFAIEFTSTCREDCSFLLFFFQKESTVNEEALLSGFLEIAEVLVFPAMNS